MATSGAAKRNRVLIVDDDLELATAYEALLNAHGYEACTAHNGIAALKIVLHTRVDAILCDLNMPELPGDLFYTEVARLQPHLLKSFIFITGNAGDPMYQHFLQRVQVPVLSKPVPAQRLLESVEKLLLALGDEDPPDSDNALAFSA